MSYTEDILKTLPDRINHRNDLMITPQWVAKDMVNLLPAEVWNKSTTFLDPACKSGIFLHEVYLKLMETDSLIKEFPDKAQRRQHILKNQLYGIALDPVSQLMTARTVYGTINGQNNIKLINNYTDIIKNKDRKYFKEALKEKFGKMEFGVVVGNPPYQESTGGEGKQSKTLYDKFIISGIEAASRLVVMITNNTFLTNDGKKQLRDEMIRAGLCRLDNYPLSGDVFKGVGVACCIFMIDRLYKGEFEYHRIEGKEIKNEYSSMLSVGDIIPESRFEIDIPKKITVTKSIADILLGEKAFGLSTKGRKGFIGGEEIIESSLIYFEGAIKLLNNFYGFEDECYVSIDDVPKGHEFIPKYKVICPRIITKQSVNALNKVRVIGPNVICTQHWSTIGAFNNKIYADNLAKYITTRLFKFLAYTYSSNGATGLNSTLLSHIPLQNFTSSSDIDWSQSVEDIDKQLYKKYNLTPDEIAYIEKTIKPMQ